MTSIVTPEARQRVRGIATPVAKFLGRLGLTPNGLTFIGFIGTCVAAMAAAAQWWLAAAILVLVFGIFDLFDGTLARATGKVSRFGAFLDSTLDRAGEAIVYIGIAVGGFLGGSYLVGLLASSAMAASFMVSYTRAKSESLGFTPGTGMANIGLAPREVRIAILTIGLLAAGLTSGWFLPQNPVDACTGMIDGSKTGQATFFDCLLRAQQLPGETPLVAALGLITVLATITAIQRILHVRTQARED